MDKQLDFDYIRFEWGISKILVTKPNMDYPLN